MFKTGKAWAAVKGGKVISLIPMRIPNDCDFELYREHATEALKVVGDVKTGEVVEVEGNLVFIQRLNHPNRGKKPREPKTYSI